MPAKNSAAPRNTSALRTATEQRKPGSPKKVTAVRSAVDKSIPSRSVGLSRRGGPRDAKQPIIMLSDRVLVQVPTVDGERRSRGGILIPATAQVSKRLAWAEVVAVGPHVRSVKACDSVLFNPEDRYEVEVRGEEYLILRERDIHAVASERIGDATGLYL